MRLMKSIYFWVLLIGVLGLVRFVEPMLKGEHGAAAGQIEHVDALGQAFEPSSPGLLGTATGLGFLLIGAWLTGRIFQQIGLPRVSGYLLFGVLVGPELAAALPFKIGPYLPLVPHEQLSYLKLIDDLAIALIALTAGCEIQLAVVRRSLKQVGIIIGAEMLFVLVGVCGALLASKSLNPLLSYESWLVAGVLCLLIGTFAIANSPAIVIAMLSETGADGPMAWTALIGTVCKDLMLIILFSLVLTVSAVALGHTDGQEESLTAVIAWHLLGSIIVGAAAAVVMTYAMRPLGDRLAIFVIGVGFALALLSDAIHLSPLLVALTAGFVQANLWPQQTQRLARVLVQLALPVYCVFFAVAGATIKVSAVMLLWPIAVAVVAVRLLMVWAGTRLGARLARLEGEAGRWVWTAFVPQAGVALALTLQTSKTFQAEPWETNLTSLLLAVIAIHELIGPPLMRYGLKRAGELQAR